MPRYLVTTKRDKRGGVASAHDLVRNEVGVTVLDARDPEMVLIETSEDVAKELKRKYNGTYFVDPETHHRLH